MKFAFFPGCNVPRRGTPELYPVAVAVCERLGIELEEFPLAPCTGSGHVQAVNPFYAHALNASTMALAEGMGLPLMTICSTCQGIFSQANQKFRQEPEYLERVNKRLAEEGIEYHGTTEVKHLLWVLVEDIGLEQLKSLVVRPLHGLRVAPFYGCYILRPSLALGFAEHPARRNALEAVITTLGAEVVDFPGKTLCCGYPIVGVNDVNSGAMVANHTLKAREQGADAIVTPCPLCHMNLDGFQPTASEQRGTRINMPVLHLPQLVALALGMDLDLMGFERHVVSTRPVVEKLGLAP